MEPTPGGPLAAVLEGMLDPAFVMVARLAKGPIGVPELSLALGDLVEADFPGYAPVVLTADLEHAWEMDGYGELSPIIAQFVVGALVTPQRLTHVYVTKTYEGADPSLVVAVPFTQDYWVNTPNTTLEFDVSIGGVETPDE